MVMAKAGAPDRPTPSVEGRDRDLHHRRLSRGLEQHRRQQAATAAQGDVKSATAYYLANIGKVKTVAQFVNNYQLFSYAMKAFGLSDMTYAKGLMTKVLNGGVTSARRWPTR